VLASCSASVGVVGVLLLACSADVRLGDLGQSSTPGQDGAPDAPGSADGAGDSASDGAADARSGVDASDAADASFDSADAACVIDCHGNPCVANVCQPVVLAPGRKTPLYLAADLTDVFFTETGHAGTLADPNPVSRVSKAGGAVALIADDDGSPRGVAVDGTFVFWNDHAENGLENVWRASKVDGSGLTLTGRFPTPVDIQGISLSPTLVYAASGNQVRYFGKTASMSFGLEATNSLVHVFGIAANQTDTVVYAADFGNASVDTMDPVGMTTTPVALGNEPVDVQIDATYAFVATGAQIVRVTLADSSTLVLATGLTGAVGVAIDVDTVYFTTKTQVRKVPKIGGASTLLTGGLTTGGRIVVDSTFAFYSDPGAGVIARVPK
jgi:hypothetical protein